MRNDGHRRRAGAPDGKSSGFVSCGGEVFGEGKTWKVLAEASPVFGTRAGSSELFPKGLILADAALRIPRHLGKI